LGLELAAGGPPIGGAPPVGGPPIGGAPLGGPPDGGPPIGGAPLGGPPDGGPPIGGPPLGGPPDGGAPVGGAIDAGIPLGPSCLVTLPVHGSVLALIIAANSFVPPALPLAISTAMDGAFGAPLPLALVPQGLQPEGFFPVVTFGFL